MRLSSTIVRYVLAACLVGLVGATSEAAVVQYWKFDDGSGTTAANTAPGGNTGTLDPGALGPMWTTTGLESSIITTAALDFDPANPDFVNGGNINLSSTGSGGAATVSMWVNPDNITFDRRIMGQVNGGFAQGGGIRMTAAGAMQVWTGGAWLNAAGSGALSAGSWQHLAFAWNNDSMTTYVDGVAQLTATSDFDFGAADGDFGIGVRLNNSAGLGFDGLIDEVAIFDTTLSLSEIQDLASGAPAIAPPVIPEPSSVLLLGLGTIGLVRQARRRRQKN